MANHSNQPLDFDEAWYLARYPDVATAVGGGKGGGLQHYIDHGKMEGRFPTQSSEAAALRNARSLTGDATLEDVLTQAVCKKFAPLLQDYLAGNSALVMESMAPRIRDLMDEKFPALLEDAVRAELERMMANGGAKR